MGNCGKVWNEHHSFWLNVNRVWVDSRDVWWTHIAAVESQLEEVGRTVSDHVLERVVVQAEVLLRDKGGLNTQNEESNRKFTFTTLTRDRQMFDSLLLFCQSQIHISLIPVTRPCSLPSGLSGSNNQRLTWAWSLNVKAVMLFNRCEFTLSSVGWVWKPIWDNLLLHLKSWTTPRLL